MLSVLLEVSTSYFRERCPAFDLSQDFVLAFLEADVRWVIFRIFQRSRCVSMSRH